MLTQIDNNKSVFTLCEDIDKMLGDGVPIGQITEFCTFVQKTKQNAYYQYHQMSFCYFLSIPYILSLSSCPLAYLWPVFHQVVSQALAKRRQGRVNRFDPYLFSSPHTPPLRLREREREIERSMLLLC